MANYRHLKLPKHIRAYLFMLNKQIERKADLNDLRRLGSVLPKIICRRLGLSESPLITCAIFLSDESLMISKEGLLNFPLKKTN